MRTTVTIDPDTEGLIREEVKRTGLSFKEVLNRSIRQAILMQSGGVRPRVEPLFSKPFPQIDGSVNQLAEVLDDEDMMRELSA